jgi:hypothetical protein
VDGAQLRRLPDPEISYVAEIIEPVCPLSSSRPSAHAEGPSSRDDFVLLTVQVPAG